MLRNRFPIREWGPVAGLVLFALVVGALLQGVCFSHHDAAHAGLHSEVAASVVTTGHSCDSEPHPHRNERVRQPALPAASADLAAPDAAGVFTQAAYVAPGPESWLRPPPAGSDLLTRLCVFRI